MENNKLTVNIKGQAVELTLDEVKQLERDLQEQMANFESQLEVSKYQQIASGSLDEIKSFISERTRIAENLDYYTNGGSDYEVEQLIPYLSSDVIRQLDFNGNYLAIANKVLQDRGEEVINPSSKNI